MSLHHGAIVHLNSRAHGKNVRIYKGEVDGRGGTGEWATFQVEMRGQGNVGLRLAAHPKTYLAIRNGKLTHGEGGPFCTFQVHTHGDGTVSLESVSHSGQHVGVQDNGDGKPPQNTGRGEHGRFNVHVYYDHGCNPLTPGSVVWLKSVAHGKNIRIYNGEVDGRGGTGEWATFQVEMRGQGHVGLRLAAHPETFLAIRDGKLTKGTGGEFCTFKVHTHHEDGSVSLESVAHPGQHVGVMDNGDGKPPQKTGTGGHGRFKVDKNQGHGNQGHGNQGHGNQGHGNQGHGNQGHGNQGHGNQGHGNHGHHGCNPLQPGSTVRLNSCHGKNIRIKDGEVDGRGGTGEWATFQVEMRGQGNVGLHLAAHPETFLAIRDGKLTQGIGGPFCTLKVHDHGDGSFSLESVSHPGQHVGVKDNGDGKPPQNTGRGNHGRFRKQ